MNRTAKKIWNAASTVLVALVVLLAVLLVGVRLVGLQVFTVLSGSMEPTYHTGSLIYVKKIDTADIQPGTVITFMLNESTIATHRVVAVVPDEEDAQTVRFRTKGDANDLEDGTLVHYKNVIGTPVFTIPYLGYVANYVQHPPGMYVAVSAGAILLPSNWSIKEYNIPYGYTPYYSRVGNVITITNSTSLIQTGQLNWPVAVLGGLGVLLIALGLITSARRRKASRA